MDEFSIAFQWLLFVVICVLVTLRRQLTIFHPIAVYLIFHCIVFCIRPTLVFLFDFNVPLSYMGISPSEEVLSQTLNATNFALLVFVTFYSITCHKGSAKDMGEVTKITRAQAKAFIIVAACLLPIAAYSIWGADIEGERIGGVYVMRGTTGYLNDFQQVLIPITMIFIVVCRWKWWSFIPFLIFILFRLNQGWGRWTIILPFFCLLCFNCWERRINFPSWKFILPIPLLLFVFNELSHNRMYFKNLMNGTQVKEEWVEEIDWESTTESKFRDNWDTLDFANFEYLVYVLDVVPEKTNRYSYGVQHLQLFTEPIPRKLWAGKPEGVPVKYFDLNHYGNFLGLTVSIIGDGWITFGWFGIFVNMAIAGLFLGLLYNWFMENQHSIFKVSIFLVIHSILLQLFRDGSIVTMAKFLLFTLLPIGCWWLLYNLAFKNADPELAENQIPELEVVD